MRKEQTLILLRWVFNFANWWELIDSLTAIIFASKGPWIEENLLKVSWILSESNNALKIWDGTYQSSLENSSALIKTLMSSEESSFIIYPGMIKNEIKNEISLIKNNS